MFCNIFNNKRVLITGHTGFKGSWLSHWLHMLGAKVHGLSLKPSDVNVLFRTLELRERVEDSVEIDIRDKTSTLNYVQSVQPDYVFHLAAQPLVRQSYINPTETFETNVGGTVNLLEALRTLPNKCTAVIVTTDKCYENKEWLHAYRENDALGGYDPYSASKGCAEIVAHSYRRSFFFDESPIRIATGRAGNVIGGGDWAEDRIFPDILRAISNKTPVPVRNKTATRPWQHVMEPLSGYLWLAAQLDREEPNNAEKLDCFNFGPRLSSNRTVEQLVKEVFKHISGAWNDISDTSQPHEASLLNLSIDKAQHLLGWQPVLDFETTIEMTVDWYRQEASSDMVQKTTDQIRQYHQQASRINLHWTN